MKKILLAASLILFSMTSIAKTLNIDDKVISYTDEGQGPALILLHPFPTDKRLWQPQHSLSKKFRLITLDFWGFGSSSATDGSAVSMRCYADEVNALMNKLNIKHAIIGGESMGGYVALAFLNKYPHRVDGLILADTQTKADSIEAQQKREAAAQQVLAEGPQQLLTDFLPKALSPHAAAPAVDELKFIADDQDATGIASALRGIAGREDTSNVLEQTAVKTLIISGDVDQVIPTEESRIMHQLAKNSRLVILQFTGHLASLEQADAWNRAVLEYFS